LFPLPLWAPLSASSFLLHSQFPQKYSRTVWSGIENAHQCTCKLQHKFLKFYHRKECLWAFWVIRDGTVLQGNCRCWMNLSPFPFPFGRSLWFPSLWRQWNRIWSSL
jgi:hypothetical protein